MDLRFCKRLRCKLILPILVGSLLLGSAGAFLEIWRSRNEHKNLLLEEAVRFRGLAKAILERAETREDLPGILATLHSVTGLRAAAVLGGSPPRILATSGSSKMPPPFATSAGDPRSLILPGKGEEWRELRNGELLRSSSPLSLERLGIRDGRLLLLLDATKFGPRIASELRGMFLTILLVLFGVVGLSVLLLEKIVLQRLHRIFEVVHARTRGEIGNSIRLDGEDEIAALGRDMNAMFRSIEEMEARTSAMIDHAPVGIVTFDREGSIETWSEGAARIFGYQAGEVCGEDFLSVLGVEIRGEDTKGFLERALRFHIAPIDGRLLEIEGRHKEGTPIHLEMAISEFELRGRRILTAVMQDVGERKAVEEKLIKYAFKLEKAYSSLSRSSSELEAALAAKSRFLAQTSHEIRTPLAAILGCTEILLDEDLPEESWDLVRAADANGRHLLRILDDILDLSKVEAGKLEIERIRFDLPRLLYEVVELMRIRAKARGNECTLVAKEPIPREIETDPTRLRQILLNLLGNAVKFTKEGRIELRAGMERGTDGAKLCFEVRDEGIGMTEEQMRHVFDAFAQAETSTARRFGGTGLGLSISRDLVRLLGGEISVESELGAGTTFRFTIDPGPLEGVPLVIPEREAEPRTAAPRPPTTVPKLKARVLLAEDGEDNRKFLRFLLKKAACEVAFAENGKEAVDLATAAREEGRPFDLILMDLQMPVLDGFEATRILRERGFDVPILALTAYGRREKEEEARAAGCDGCLSKPLDRALFFRTLEAVLGHTEGGEADPGAELRDPALTERPSRG